MNIVTKIVHKVHTIFGLDPDIDVKNKETLRCLKRDVMNGKKKDIQEIKKASKTVKFMIKSGTLEVLILNNGKK